MQERALARTGGADQAQQVGPLEFLPECFDLGLAAKKELRIIGSERGQPRDRAASFSAPSTRRVTSSSARDKSQCRTDSGPRGRPTTARPSHLGPGAIRHPRRLFTQGRPKFSACLQCADPLQVPTISASITPAAKTSARASTVITAQLLRGHVGGGSRHRAGRGLGHHLGNAKIHDHYPAQNG